MFNETDQVMLRSNKPHLELLMGMIGTVTWVYDDGRYDVEFSVGYKTKPILVSLPESDLKRV